MDPLDYLFSLELFGIKLGLANIRHLCEALGRPQDSFRSILIAGTNGKGSVTAFVDRGLRAAGHRVARYTSPHLMSIRERFVINGQPVPEQALRSAAADLRVIVDQLMERGVLEAHPTFFEVTTALGFELFRRASVEIAVVEVGLGGRLDATNVLEPFLTAVTTIELDHEQQLGSSLRSIAFEKAGIIKPSVPIVLGELPADARPVIEDVAREAGSPVIRAHDGRAVSATVTNGMTRVTLESARASYGPLNLALRGRHQIDNAVVAVCLLEEADARGVRAGSADIATALTDTRWPGRLDLRVDAKGRTVLLDAAHNPGGAATLAAYLAEAYPQNLPIVFGAMRDKRTHEMLAELVPHASRLILTRAPTRRAVDPSDLARQASTLVDAARLTVEADVSAALELAWAAGETICVAGSIFLVGEVISMLEPQ